MKLKILLSIIFVVILSVVLFTLGLVPYHFYNLALDEGMDSDFLKLPVMDKTFHLGNSETLEDVSIVEIENQNVWRKFHLHNFEIPLPFSHPLISCVPIAEYNKEKTRVGMKFIGTTGEELFSYKENDTGPFTLIIDQEKLFSLPLVRDILMKKKSEEIWKDIFAKNIILPQKINFATSLDYYKALYEISYKELIYRLFILRMRVDFFKDYRVEKYSWEDQLKLVIIRKKIDDESFIKETVLMMSNSIISSVDINFKKWNHSADVIRSMFLKTLNYSLTNNEQAISLYGEYRHLPFVKRKAQAGMLYLFAAWTHQMSDKKFLKEMIQFLERGKEHKYQLKPLYKYSFERYGTSFSLKDENRKNLETAHERLKRKAEEEMKKLRAGDATDEQLETLDFESGEKRMDFFLNEAREKGLLEDDDID